MKILLMGDASNYHAALAGGLQSLGHEVCLASDGGGWIRTPRDIDVSRGASKAAGLALYGRMSLLQATSLRGFDVVQFISPGFIQLRPARLESLLRRFRRQNGSLFLSAIGYDHSLVRNLTSSHPALAYSEWQVEGRPMAWREDSNAQYDQWMSPVLAAYNDVFYSHIDGAVTALYEYHRIIEAEHPSLPVTYGGIPVDTAGLPRHSNRTDGKIRILYACRRGREGEKGADVLLPMLHRLEAERPGRVEIVSPPNMPFADFVRVLSGCDIVCDQLYSYTPGTTALMAMSMGVIPISGGEEEYYRFIGEPPGLRPVFNPDPLDLEGTYARLLALVDDPELLRSMAACGPGFVRRHNDAVTVARRFVSAWEGTGG
ncbi:MAG: hypothetical protein K2J38_03255 [Muribaculaceae bacterium]|nr:hypothetical protein [Muribaculaceae bacterium]